MGDDIRSLGSRGQAVFDTATRLREAGLVDDAKFKELTNTDVGRQDLAIGNEALNALKADTPGANKLAFAIPMMNNNITVLQRESLSRNREELARLRAEQGVQGAQGSQ